MRAEGFRSKERENSERACKRSAARQRALRAAHVEQITEKGKYATKKVRQSCVRRQCESEQGFVGRHFCCAP